MDFDILDRPALSPASFSKAGRRDPTLRASPLRSSEWRLRWKAAALETSILPTLLACRDMRQMLVHRQAICMVSAQVAPLFDWPSAPLQESIVSVSCGNERSKAGSSLTSILRAQNATATAAT
jgi:hypothetical protein